MWQFPDKWFFAFWLRVQLNFLYSVMSLIGAVAARSFSRPDCTMTSTMDLECDDNDDDDNDDDDTERIILVEMVVVFLVLLLRPDFKIMRPRIWSVMMVMMTMMMMVMMMMTPKP